MKIKTIIRIYDVLVEEGYKANVLVTESKKQKWGLIKITFKKGKYKFALFSETYSTKYILRNLEGIPFECKII